MPQARRQGLPRAVHAEERAHRLQVKLPGDYYFGVSAASADTPDTFEVFKFVVNLLSSGTQQANAAPAQDQGAPASGPSGQSGDIQNRLDTMPQQIVSLESSLKAVDTNAHNRHQELLRDRSSGGGSAEAESIRLGGMERRLEAIERTVLAIQKEVEGQDYRARLDRLHEVLETTHSNLMTHLPASMNKIVSSSAPNMSLFFVSVVLVQLGLAVSYVVYKRRRANAPKKYL